MAGVTAIAVGAAVLTNGVAAPLITTAAVITVAAGAATSINGVSEFGETVTGHNFMRKDVFHGNETTYKAYARTTAVIAQIGTIVCGGWLKINAPRIEAYNNIQSYQYTKTISDAQHMNRPYANSVLTQREVIKYGKMIKDSFGYVFSIMGSVNGKEKLWRLGVNIREKLIWHWGHGL